MLRRSTKTILPYYRWRKQYGGMARMMASGSDISESETIKMAKSSRGSQVETALSPPLTFPATIGKEMESDFQEICER
jgi:hypothetical protein